MIRPTIIFEPHVPEELQSYDLIKEAEYSFQEVFNHINNTSCKTESSNKFVPPVIFLSKEIIRSTNCYGPRDVDEFCLDYIYREKMYANRNGAKISTIVLHQYIPESHTIILYYEAIKEYASAHQLEYQETYEYALAAALFETLHRECFSKAFIFQKHKHPISDKCEMLKISLAEYYAYCYCVDSGYVQVEHHLVDTWHRYFLTTYPYAQALYFMLDRPHLSYVSYDDSIRKHLKVFSITRGIYQTSIDDAISKLHS